MSVLNKIQLLIFSLKSLLTASVNPFPEGNPAIFSHLKLIVKKTQWKTNYPNYSLSNDHNAESTPLNKTKH